MYAMAAFLLLSVVPLQVSAVTGVDPISTPATTPAESARAEVLTARLSEIKEMDRSSMNASEKKEMRKEVRSIKKELREQASGVYLSVGALLLVVLLLILLL